MYKYKINVKFEQKIYVKRSDLCFIALKKKFNHTVDYNSCKFFLFLDKDVSSDREVLRLRRIILDKESHIARLKDDIERNEEDYQIEMEQMQSELDNMKEFFLAEKEEGGKTLMLKNYHSLFFLPLTIATF